MCPILWRLLALALLLVLRPLRVLRLVLPRPLRLLGAGRGARPSHRESGMATVTLPSLLLRTGGFTLTEPEPGTDWCTVAASSRHPTLDTPPVSRVTRQHYTHTHTPHR